MLKTRMATGKSSPFGAPLNVLLHRNNGLARSVLMWAEGFTDLFKSLYNTVLVIFDNLFRGQSLALHKRSHVWGNQEFNICKHEENGLILNRYSNKDSFNFISVFFAFFVTNLIMFIRKGSSRIRKIVNNNNQENGFVDLGLWLFFFLLSLLLTPFITICFCVCSSQ